MPLNRICFLKYFKKFAQYHRDCKLDLIRICWPMEAFLNLAKDIWDFLKVRKKYWLPPLIITIILTVIIFIITDGSAVAPFIYSFFE